MVQRQPAQMTWTPFALIFLGLWQLIAPLTFGYTDPTHLVSGALLIAGGFYLTKKPSLKFQWAVAFVGLWLQLAPLILWAKSPAHYLNDTLVGVLVILFAIILPSHEKKEAAVLPPGWSYNPSAWPTRLLIAFFACMGWFISRYLAAYQLGYIDTMWDPFFENGTINVITSSVSLAFPVSDAGLGAASYTIELLLTCYGCRMRWCHSPWLVVIYGILVVPVSLVSIALIILQPLAVGSWCTLCLMTAVCMLCMATLAVSELILVLQMLKKTKGVGFWTGFNIRPATSDRRVSAALTGITPTWRLSLSALLGVVLMVLAGPLKDFDTILGAFTIVTSFISMAEPVRSWRFANGIWGFLLLGATLWLHPSLFSFFLHIGIALLLILLCWKPGALRESCK